MRLVQPIRSVTKIKKMKEAAAASSPRDAALLEVGFQTALRIQDILSLHVGDVATCDRGKWKVSFYIRITEMKTGKQKFIKLVPSARQAICSQLENLEHKNNHGDWLFPSRVHGGDKSLSRWQAARMIKKFAKEAGVTEPVSCHSLRKSFGYHVFHNGVDVMYLKEIYNHADISITKRYIGITQDDINTVYQKAGMIYG